MLNHLSIIPDGNRRWAKKYKKDFLSAYKEGTKKIEEVVEWWTYTDIKILSIYLLSRDNITNRSKLELNIILELMYNSLKKNLDKISEQLIENNIGVYFIGELENIPEKIRNIMMNINIKSSKIKNYKKLYFLVAYSGRREIENAIKNCRGSYNITECLWIKENVDLIFRSGGYYRLSDLLLYQSAYAEIYVTNKLWPEIEIKDIEVAIKWFKSIKRNFGK